MVVANSATTPNPTPAAEPRATAGGFRGRTRVGTKALTIGLRFVGQCAGTAAGPGVAASRRSRINAHAAPQVRLATQVVATATDPSGATSTLDPHAAPPTSRPTVMASAKRFRTRHSALYACRTAYGTRPMAS